MVAEGVLKDFQSLQPIRVGRKKPVEEVLSGESGGGRRREVVPESWEEWVVGEWVGIDYGGEHLNVDSGGGGGGGGSGCERRGER